MAEISGFHNSINGDRKVKADFFARFFGSLIGNGVFPNPSTGCQVIANNDMTVTVKTGKAWINGVFYENTADMALSLDVADGVLKRIDRVVLQYNTIDRTIAAKVKKGTFASSPVAPSLQRDADAYELGIADILVSNGVISVTQANITDLRLNTTYCGIVHGVVDQVDTTTIFNQYQAWFGEFSGDAEAEFNTFLAQLENALSGDVAGNLLVKINENTADILKKLDRDDYVKSPGYAISTGSANTYAVTLDPTPTAYIDGMGVVVKINVQNTGASTINVNGLGAKSILDGKGNAMTSGKLKAGTPYTLRYNGVNFILQGEGASGNATASDLLSGKTASTDAGDITGTLSIKSVVNPVESSYSYGYERLISNTYVFDSVAGDHKDNCIYHERGASPIKIMTSTGSLVTSTSLPTEYDSSQTSRLWVQYSDDNKSYLCMAGFKVGGGGAIWKKEITTSYTTSWSLVCSYSSAMFGYFREGDGNNIITYFDDTTNRVVNVKWYSLSNNSLAKSVDIPYPSVSFTTTNTYFYGRRLFAVSEEKKQLVIFFYSSNFYPYVYDYNGNLVSAGSNSLTIYDELFLCADNTIAVSGSGSNLLIYSLTFEGLLRSSFNYANTGSPKIVANKVGDVLGLISRDSCIDTYLYSYQLISKSIYPPSVSGSLDLLSRSKNGKVYAHCASTGVAVFNLLDRTLTFPDNLGSKRVLSEEGKPIMIKDSSYWIGSWETISSGAVREVTASTILKREREKVYILE